MYGEDAVLAIAMLIYVLILGLWWLVCGIMAHSMFSKKGYRHAGLYVLAWLPLINSFVGILLAIGLPDVLLHRKMDYLLRQMAANGLIPGPQAQQPVGCSPQTGAQAAPARNPAQMFQFTQTANTAPEQPVRQPQTTVAPAPENLFCQGSPGNN